MSTNEEGPIPTPVEEVLADKEPENLLEQLAAKRRDMAEHREIDLPVPGYDVNPPLLLIRYKLLDGHTLTQIGMKIRKQSGNDRWSRALNAALDTFIAACTGFYVDLGEGIPEPLTFNGQHIRGFTSELAKALQFFDELPETPTARSVAMGLFAGNDVAVTQHSYLLNRWFQNTSIDINEEMLLEGNL